MTRVLVLNATFEPLSVVPARRAIVLMLDERAQLLHATGRRVRSERLSVDEPSVVRLLRFVRVPYQSRRTMSRRAVFARDSNECQYCGASAESIDHVVPRSRGGDHTWENVVAACRRCNTTKRDRLLSETALRLRTLPGPPPRATWFLVAAGAVPIEWEPYLGMATSRSA
jgi:5-methylcytosine-specific restriction endonuclease McrA